MPSVYIHTVNANGKKYVGQCVGDPKTRWGANGHRYKKQFFYNAIEKYGWQNITHEIVAQDVSQEEADRLEQYYIDLYKTTDREFGYNIELGGKAGYWVSGGKVHNARPVICVETSETWECSTDCARSLGVNLASLQESLYHGYRCKGRHYKYMDDNNYTINKGKFQIRCKETGQIWPSVRDCAKETGIHERNIARYCRNERNPRNGFHYEFYVV